MFSFDKIYSAYLKCRKRKRNTINALKFDQNLLENLIDLETSLKNKTYAPKRSVCFMTSSPKPREIFAADFSDRVVHHLVVPILEQMYEPKFIHDSYSNRKNKGTHKAIKRALHFMRATTHYLQLDIKNFFYSIDKDILFEKLSLELSNKREVLNTYDTNYEEFMWLIGKIIYNDVSKNAYIKGDKNILFSLPPHKSLFKVAQAKGLPIGNLTSQFFANVYMNDFDNFVKRELKCKRYIRYVDDFILFDTKEELEKKHKQIKEYLQTKLQLELKNQTFLKSNKEGANFLGYIVRPDYILVRNRVVNNYKYKKAKYLAKYEKLRGNMKLEEIKPFLSVQASFFGHIKHANSFNLKKKVGIIDDEKNWNLIYG